MKQLMAFPEQCTGCRRCEAACQESHALADGVSGSPRLTVVYHRGRYYPEVCRHCAEAPCVEACMSGAMRRDAGTGLVYVETGRCRGCWMCLMACPFGVIQADRVAEVAHKCDGCRARATAACVGACAPGALVVVEEAAVEGPKRRGRGLRRGREDG